MTVITLVSDNKKLYTTLNTLKQFPNDIISDSPNEYLHAHKSSIYIDIQFKNLVTIVNFMRGYKIDFDTFTSNDIYNLKLDCSKIKLNKMLNTLSDYENNKKVNYNNYNSLSSEDIGVDERDISAHTYSNLDSDISNIDTQNKDTQNTDTLVSSVKPRFSDLDSNIENQTDNPIRYMTDVATNRIIHNRNIQSDIDSNIGGNLSDIFIKSSEIIGNNTTCLSSILGDSTKGHYKDFMHTLYSATG